MSCKIKIKRYIFNLDEIPSKYRSSFQRKNVIIQKAIDSPGKLVREYAGCYYIVLDDELVAIDNQQDEVGQPHWIAKEASPRAKWYSDPHPTLKSLKKELGI